MRHLKTWLIILAAFVLIGGYSAYAMLKPGPAVPAATVEQGTLRAYVEERGRTDLPRVWRLTMPADGRIEAIAIEPGTAVAKGDLLARMDRADLDAAVKIAQAELERIDAELAVVRDEALPATALEELNGWISTVDTLAEAAEEVIKANKDHAAFADWWQQAEAKLKDQGAVADEQYRRAKTESSEAAVDLAVSRLQHEMVLAVRKIVGLGPKYVRDYLGLKGLKAAVLQREREAAEVRLDQAKRERARGELHAPVDGVVLRRAVRNEQVLPAGSELLAVGDPALMQVRADLLSQAAAAVGDGDEVEITGSGLGDVPLKGEVIRVHPEAFTKRSSLGVDQQRVRIDIALKPGELDRLARAGQRLGVGYRVQVRVYTEQANDALIIPALALFRGDDGGWRVYRIEQGRAVDEAVEIGLGNPDRVQVTRGLAKGDQVVVSPPKSLVSGARVTGVVAQPSE